MKLRSMIFKVLLALVLSSVATLIVDLVLQLVIPSGSEKAQAIYTLILVIASPVALSTLLVYLLHIYGGNGESEVCEEYPDKYPGIFRDIPKVIRREWLALLFIIALGLLGMLVWLINSKLLHSDIVTRLSALLLSASPLALVYQSLLSYLLGTLLTAAIYVLVFALFRFKWRKFM